MPVPPHGTFPMGFPGMTFPWTSLPIGRRVVNETCLKEATAVASAVLKRIFRKRSAFQTNPSSSTSGFCTMKSMSRSTLSASLQEITSRLRMKSGSSTLRCMDLRRICERDVGSDRGRAFGAVAGVATFAPQHRTTGGKQTVS